MSTPRILGAGGPAVFPVGLGCMGMSEFYGTSDDAESLRTLDRALDLGIDFFDTADTYGFGHNEALLGQWLRAGGPARCAPPHAAQLRLRPAAVRAAAAVQAICTPRREAPAPL